MIKRDEVLVYFKYSGDTGKYISQLDVTIEYISKRAGYAVLYVDHDKVDSVLKSLEEMKGFKSCEVSPTDLEELNI